jgi:uncharacterized protein YqeY
MPIVDDVTRQMKEAMKAKDGPRLAALRQMRTAFLNEMKKDGADTVSDEVCKTLLRKLEKQRKESIEAFSKGGREEMAEAERAELAVIQEFLPRLADEARTTEWVEAAIAEAGATGPRDMGKVMGALMKAHKSEIDGNVAQRIVKALLGG